MIANGVVTGAGPDWFDDVSLTRGSADPGFFDGSTVDSTADYAYAWSGTVGTSISNRYNFSILNDRLRQVIAAHNTPARVITSVTYNAQSEPTLAASVDVQDRVRLVFCGQTQDSRVVGIRHGMDGDRWTTTLDLDASYTS